MARAQLLAAYPPSSDDLSTRVLAVVSVYGTRDGLAGPEKIAPSRALALAVIAAHQEPIPQILYSAAWERAVRDQLSQHPAVDLIAEAPDLPAIAGALQRMISDPVDREYFVTWPILEQAHRTAGGWRIRFAVRAPGSQS